MNCSLCEKFYSFKTLNKHRGIFCKGCYFKILIDENKIHQDNIGILKKELNDARTENKRIKDENILLITKSTDSWKEKVSNITFKKLLNENKIFFENNIDNHTEKGIKIYSICGKIIYKGDVLNGSYHNFGIYYFQNGDMYEGYWIKGNRNGIGKYYSNNSLIYNGDWMNDKMHGKGKTFYYNGDINYDGEWVNGKKEGRGIRFFDGLHGGLAGCGKKGDIYNGYWKNDKKNGYGVYTFASGAIYKGEWENGIRNGRGKSYFKTEKLRYDGGWKCGKYHGKGKVFNDDEVLVYDGDHKDGLKDGEGKSYDTNGKLRYDGGWKDDKYNGNGEEYNDGILIREGIWKDNNFIYRDNELCIVCFTNKKCFAFIPCGHLCMCENCKDKYSMNTCIICRSSFSELYKIYVD